MKSDNTSIIVFDLSKVKEIKNLSLEAQGLFSCMINNPKCDYASLDDLHKLLPMDNINSIKNSLKELIDSNFVFERQEKFIINKNQLVSKTKVLTTDFNEVI